MALVMLGVVHGFQDRVIDPFRSQRQFAARLEQVIDETGPDTELILFGAEEHELVAMMPERFEAIPRFRFGLLRGRLAALADRPALVLMSRKDRDNEMLFGTYVWGDLAHVLQEVPTNLPQYDRAHNDALVILRAPRGRSAGSGRTSQPSTRKTGPTEVSLP